MRRFHKCVLSAVAGMSLALPVWAQVSDQEEKLVLPDVTTTVSGDALVAGKDALPDYSVVLPELRSAKSLLPTLPGIESYDDFDEPVADLSVSWNKSVFCQGLIGGGFPGYFVGDFSVYKETIDSPFSVDFHHLSRNGYGKLSAADGYFDMSTKLGGIKEFSVNSFDFDLGAGYETLTLGLQNSSNVFYQVTSQDIAGVITAKWNLPNNFYMSLSDDNEYYFRFGGLLKDVDSSIEVYEQEKNGASFCTTPVFKLGWRNEFLKLGLDAGYEFEKYVGDMSEGQEGRDVSNRGKFGFSAEWINPVINVSANCGLVISDNLAENENLVVPFDVVLKGSWPVSYSTVPVTLLAAGGLKSYRFTLGDMERDYAFVAAKGLSSESSDWYGKFDLGIPLINAAKFSVGVDFRKTAFENLYWTGCYSEEISQAGLYSMAQVDRTQVDVVASGEFFYKVFGFNVKAVSHFMYVPVKEDRFFVEGSCNYESITGVWGTEISLREAIGDGADLVPNLSGTAYFKINDALRVSVELNDAIKMFSGVTRIYAHSNYKESAGNLILLVKFFF